MDLKQRDERALKRAVVVEDQVEDIYTVAIALDELHFAGKLSNVINKTEIGEDFLPLYLNVELIEEAPWVSETHGDHTGFGWACLVENSLIRVGVQDYNAIALKGSDIHDERELRASLLHYLAHIKLVLQHTEDNLHGREFLRELQRLVDRGEFALQAQVDFYSQAYGPAALRKYDA